MASATARRILLQGMSEEDARSSSLTKASRSSNANPNSAGSREPTARPIARDEATRRPTFRPFEESMFEPDVVARARKLVLIKRNGEARPFDLAKLYVRCESARNPRFSSVLNMRSAPELENVDVIALVSRIVSGTPPVIHASEFDKHISRVCLWSVTDHPEYNVLGGRIMISSMEKSVPESILEVVRSSGKGSSLSLRKTQILMPWYVQFVERYHETLTNMMDFTRDYVTGEGYRRRNSFGLMALDGLEKAFLKLDGRSIERPQHLYMRVAVAQVRVDAERLLKGEPVDEEALFARIKDKYDIMSSLIYTHASPTLFNSGTSGGLASCFLFEVRDTLTDEEPGQGSIYGTLQETAKAAKGAGGLATSFSRLRSQGTLIAGTQGTSSGLARVLKLYDDSSLYVDQGGNKRPGSNAIYLSTIHPESRNFACCRSNADNASNRLRVDALFPALWVEDVVMEAFLTGKKIHQLDPSEYPGLCDAYGEKFEALYRAHVSEAKRRLNAARATPDLVPLGTTPEKFVGYHVERAADFVDDIVEMFQGSGLPYVAFKDHVNHRNNMIDLDDPEDEIIQSLNLCVEVAQKPSTICNLSSIDVSAFVDPNTRTYRYDDLYRTVRAVVRNLNDVIDATEYKVPKTRETNMSYRPMGVGVQGTANAFVKLGYPYASNEAYEVDKRIHETMYFAALSESCELAKKHGPYPKYAGSPASKGLLQQDLFARHWEYMSRKIDKLKVTMTLRARNLSAKIAVMDRLIPYVEEMIGLLPKVEILDKEDAKKTPSMRLEQSGNRVVSIMASYPAFEEMAAYFRDTFVPLALGKKLDAELPDRRKITEMRNALMTHAQPRFAREMAEALRQFVNAAHERRDHLNTDLGDVYANREIFEDLVALREEYGHPYESSGLWDWDALREDIARYGLRNCLLIALMPTASTSVVLNRTDSFEPFRSMVYTRTMNNGSYACVADQLVEKLVERGLWNDEMRNAIHSANGLLSRVKGVEIPRDLVELFATSYEIPMMDQIKFAYGRSRWVDQSMSFNWHVLKQDDPSKSSAEQANHLKNMDFKRLVFTWLMGLKTAKYYNRMEVGFVGQNPSNVISMRASTEAASRADSNKAGEESESMVCEMRDGCTFCHG